MKIQTVMVIILLFCLTLLKLYAQEKPKLAKDIIYFQPIKYDTNFVEQLKLARETGKKTVKHKLLQNTLLNSYDPEAFNNKDVPQFNVFYDQEIIEADWSSNDIPVFYSSSHEKSPTIERMVGLSYTPDIMVACELWDGIIYPDKIRVRRSSDHGASFPLTPTINIDEVKPLSLPKMKQISNNEVGISFVYQYSEVDHDIYYAKVNKDLSIQTITPVETSSAHQTRPFITSDFTNYPNEPYVYIIYYEINESTSKLMFKISIDVGVTWSESIELDNFTSPYQPYCSISFGYDKLFVAYTTRGDLSDDIKAIFSYDFGESWSTPNNLVSSDNDELYPEISISSANTWFVFYEYHYSANDIDIYYRYTDDGGVSWNGSYDLASSGKNERFPSVRNFIPGSSNDVYSGYVNLEDNNVSIYKANFSNPTNWNFLSTANSGNFQISDDDPIALLPKYTPDGLSGVGVGWVENHEYLDSQGGSVNNYDIYFHADWFTGVPEINIKPSIIRIIEQ